MKHALVPKDYEDLSIEEKTVIKSLKKKEIGDLIFCSLSFQEIELRKYNGVYTGVVTGVDNDSYSSIWNLNGHKTSVFKYISSAEDYPLFYIHQLEELLKTLNIKIVHYDIDSMWMQFCNNIET